MGETKQREQERDRADDAQGETFIAALKAEAKFESAVHALNHTHKMLNKNCENGSVGAQTETKKKKKRQTLETNKQCQTRTATTTGLLLLEFFLALTRMLVHIRCRFHLATPS